jgi:chromosome partitioning protein
VFGCLTVTVGITHMLAWFKRNSAPAPAAAELPVGGEEQKPSADERVERLLGRLGPPSGTVPSGTVPSGTVHSGMVPSGTVHSGTVSEAAAGFGQMRVIAVASQKGGSGKTTVAAHLAVQAGIVGHGPAVLIDTDPQGSLGEWWRARNDEAPALATVKLDELTAHLAELRSYGTAVAIIDTPPALTASIEQVIAIADLVLIPARPSPHDLRAVGATVEMIRRAGKPFLFVVNGAAPRANITAQAVAALSEHGRVSPTILYQRTDYAASMTDGRTVMEAAPNGRSAQEIAGLWQHVHAQIAIRAAA